MTQVFEPPAVLEMEAELDAVKRRYQSMLDSEEVEVAPGVGAKALKGHTTEVWVHLYNLKDGTVSTVTTEAAQKKIKQRGPDGSMVWSLRPPAHFQYERDKVTGRPVKVNETVWKCRLHPTADDREWLDRIGLMGRECMKANIPSQFALEQHMTMKHKAEWKVIQREEEAKTEREARDVARMQAEAMLALAGRGGGEQAADVTVYRCREGGCSRFFDTEQGLAIHKGRDHKE